MTVKPRDEEFDAVFRGASESLADAASRPSPPAIETGQIWRARWDGVSVLVLIDSSRHESGHCVHVAPVQIGTDCADETAIVLPPSSNPLSVVLSVWPELATEIAEIVLDRWITKIVNFASLATLTEAAASGVLRRGAPILNTISSRLREKKLLELSVRLLTRAARPRGGAGTLGDILRYSGSAGVPSAIAATLGTSTAVALQIVRGDLFIDRTQAEVLGHRLGIKPDQLLEANPAIPGGLLFALTSLERGDQVRRLAEKEGITDSDAFETVMSGSYALAARGEGAEARDWAGRVDRYLATALGT